MLANKHKTIKQLGYNNGSGFRVPRGYHAHETLAGLRSLESALCSLGAPGSRMDDGVGAGGRTNKSMNKSCGWRDYLPPAPAPGSARRTRVACAYVMAPVASRGEWLTNRRGLCVLQYTSNWVPLRGFG